MAEQDSSDTTPPWFVETACDWSPIVPFRQFPDLVLFVCSLSARHLLSTFGFPYIHENSKWRRYLPHNKRLVRRVWFASGVATGDCASTPLAVESQWFLPTLAPSRALVHELLCGLHTLGRYSSLSRRTGCSLKKGSERQVPPREWVDEMMWLDMLRRTARMAQISQENLPFRASRPHFAHLFRAVEVGWCSEEGCCLLSEGVSFALSSSRSATGAPGVVVPTSSDMLTRFSSLLGLTKGCLCPRPLGLSSSSGSFVRAFLINKTFLGIGFWRVDGQTPKWLSLQKWTVVVSHFSPLAS